MKKILNYKYILWGLVLLSNFTFSQNTKPSIAYYTLEDGLSQVSSNDLLLDSSGFIWIATQDGLNRFDGNTFKHFKSHKSDSTQISGSFITKLCEDKNKNIWVGTNTNGLNCYDYSSNSFRRIRINNLQKTNISSLVTDGEDNIWVGSRDSGVYQLNINNHSQQKVLDDVSVTALHYQDENTLWIGGISGGIYSLNPSNGQKPLLKGWVKGNVQAFYDVGEHLLIGSYDGLFKYDKKTEKVDLIEIEESGDYLTKHVVSFLKAGPTEIWIGTGRGLYLFDWKKNLVLRKIEYDETLNSGLTNNTVQSLLKVSQNQVLVGTANGLNLIDLKPAYFKNISKDTKGNTLLNDNVIFSIHKNEMGLWVGTSDGGLNLIQENKTHFFLDNKNNKTSLAGPVVRGIVEDEENERLWIATTRGLSLIDLKTFNPEKPIFKNFYHDHDNINSLNTNFLKDIALDRNNNLWGSAFEYGIFRLELSDENEAKITRYQHNPNNENSLVDNITQCIKVDQEGAIWIGTQNGLSKLTFFGTDYEKSLFTNYQNTQGDSKSLSHNSVYDILFDKKNRLWIGTRSGLNLFNKDKSFTSWTSQNQFTSDIVYSIQDDTYGNLWLGTNDGIVKYHPEKNQFTQYGIEDGIQSKEFDIHARFRDKDGIIYLGGIGGVTYFHPNDLEEIDRPQPLYFSELKVKGKAVKVENSAKSVLKKTLAATQQLEFKHNEFPFFLQFSSIDYRINKNVEYAYKLLQTDTEWTFLKEPEVQFLNLPAGSYTLQVNGFSRGKEWEQEPLKMNLKILPPWWATWWAYLIYAYVLLGMAYFFYRFQISRKLAIAESTRLKEINQLKNSLYDNITHEFRTPLTVVLGMTDSLENELQAKTNPSINNAIEMIRRNGKSLLSLVNEMLDLSKLESGSMELNLVQTDAIPFVKYLSESFHSLAEAKNINLTVYSEINTLEMDIDVNKVASIISNLLSNAIKFTSENGKIIVHLNKIETKDGALFSIKVQDNGLGLSEENIKHLFDRFYQADNQASQYQEGTGIGLSLTKEFTELMNGTITVESTLGKGSTFIVQLPVTNTADKTVEAKITVEPPIKKAATPLKTATTVINETSALPLALIIEDNEDVAYYLKTCLKGKYQTLHAINGNKGIEMAYEKIPDIIISDVMMPGKDGFEVCAILKSDVRTDHIPIVLLTAKVTTEDRLIGLSHGADAYLAKPFNEKELFIRLNQLILIRKKLVEKIQKDGLNTFLDKRAESPETKFLQKVIQYVHEDISNSDFGSSDLANKLHLSESQVYRKLKAITDKSTAIFIRSIRLQKAKEFIETTDKTISEIAYETGFNDPSWFSRAFKEEFGFAPSEIHK